MKTLTELVKIRELLESVFTTDHVVAAVDALEADLSAIGNETPIVEFQDDIEQVVTDLGRVYSDLQFTQERFNLVLQRINQRIQSEAQKFYTDNYSLELRVESEAVDNIRKIRVLNLSANIQQDIISRIQLHTSWKYPALEIGCRDGEWTKHLVAADPLYITDHYRDFLESASQQFPDEYQRRLRSYLSRDTDLSMLPSGQFGFVFCWNFLNYRSLDTIKEYLKSVKELLRPGGVFMFSYNNADQHEQAGYAEGFWMSYMPKSMLVPLCESLGFEVVQTRDVRGEGTAVSWIELKKSGTLQTVKAHQVLGEIKRI